MSLTGTQDYDRKYLLSMPGLCKLACLLCSFVGILCIICGPVRVSNFRGSFYLAVVTIGFVATGCLLLARYLRLWQRQFCRCDPTLWSLAVHSSLALAYFAASGLVLFLDIGAYTAAAFFGLTAFCINGLEAYGNYRRSRQREVATQTI
ncbi:GD16736 [Drosophila simulans]|uniref:GD16736 n=1 Tax=Drosophila simulans TaxID=7240 RepID=B4R4Z3_DROSI|nr:GD16736 [Drosophila simulans]